MKIVENILELDAERIHQDAERTKLFIYYSASWCMPCKIVKPILTLLEEKHPEIKFLNVDVEHVESNVRSLPAFMISGYIETVSGYWKVHKTLIGINTLEMFEDELKQLFHANH